MISGELMMIEVAFCGIMFMADVNHRNLRVRKLLGRGIAPLDAAWILCEKQAAGKEVVIVRASGVGDDLGEHGQVEHKPMADGVTSM